MAIELVCKLLKDGTVEEIGQLVRCKNCIHRYTEKCKMRVEFEGDGSLYDWTEDDSFCDDGEDARRERGFWIQGICSVCEGVVNKETPFCPYCGAEMMVD